MIALLSIAIFLPAVLAAPTFLLGRKNPKMAKILGVGTTAIVFAISILILVFFQYGQPGFQLSESAPWASTFGLNYKVGIDGISLPLLMIATFLSLLSAAGSWDQITFRHAEYYALFLIFETGIIGVFTSLNLILFYLFWEIVLIPMFFFIGIWGGPRRRYASLKFLIFTYSGSAVMLFGFLALYAWTGTSAYPGGPSFDYDVLAVRIPNLALPLQLAVAVTTFVGFAVKLPIFPLHTWLPDAHVEAPAPVSVLLAGLLLKMGGYGLIRYNLLLFLASMAAVAVPGFANFTSEYLVIQGALSVSSLFAIAIVAPALTVGYFLCMLRRVAMTPPVGPKNELHLHSILILVAFLVPLLIFGVYPPPLLGSVITPTVEKWVGTIVALGAR